MLNGSIQVFVGILSASILMLVYEKQRTPDVWTTTLVMKNRTSSKVTTAAAYDSDWSTSNITLELTKNVPRVIIVGVMKCGTTATAAFLSKHSRLYDLGETNFYNLHYKKGLKYYMGRERTKHYKPGAYAFEHNPLYYKNFDVPKRILKANPETKILLVVCDNVRRMISRYLHLKEAVTKGDSDIHNFDGRKKKLSEVGETFEEYEDNLVQAVSRLSKYIEKDTDPEFLKKMSKKHSQHRPPFDRSESYLDPLIAEGFYIVFYEKWKKFFGRDQLMVVDGTNIGKNPADEMIKIQKFLKIPIEIDYSSFKYNEEKQFYCHIEKCLKESKGRSAGIHFNETVREKVKSFFDPFDKRIKKIINNDVAWDY